MLCCLLWMLVVLLCLSIGVVNAGGVVVDGVVGDEVGVGIVAW